VNADQLTETCYAVNEAKVILRNNTKSRKSLDNNQSNRRRSNQHTTEQSDLTCHETSMDENDLTTEDQERKRQIRRRKRSKSPGGAAIFKPPEEIMQHIKYGIIESSNMTADQLKEIPFIKVETSAPAFRISPHQKHRRISPHRRKSGSAKFFIY
jgi:hypothetical protein